MLATDILLTEFGATGAHFVVSYEIADEAAPAFNVSVYRSADGVTLDALVGSRPVTLEERTTGKHTIGIGASFIDVRTDYRLIAVVDSSDDVLESSEENNRIAFRGGAVIAPDGVVHVHGSDAADIVSIRSSANDSANRSITLKINAWTMDYASASVREIHLRLHGGDDVLTVTPHITQNIHAYGGLGDDRITSGAGSDWLLGGDGDDLLASRAHRDLLDGGEGNDILLGGAHNDTLVGFGGNDRLNGGSGKDIVDGGEDADTVAGGDHPDLVWSGAGPDRIVAPLLSDEPLDASAEDTLTPLTPEDLLFGELTAEDDSFSAMTMSSDGYGYGGYAGPFWFEPSFGNTIYQPEGETGSFYPFDVIRSPEDKAGLPVTIPISYTGTASAGDFIYRQSSVTMGTAMGVGLAVFDDTASESTEYITGHITSGYDYSTGVHFSIGYPSTGQPPNDTDGNPSLATAYIVDGNVTLYDENEVPRGEAEENSAMSLDIGTLYRLEVTTSHTPSDPYEFALWYDGSLAIWPDQSRTNQVFDGYAAPGMIYGYVTPGTYYVEALGPTSDVWVSLVRMHSNNSGHIDWFYVSAVDLDIDSDNNNGYNLPDRSLYEDQIENDPAYPGKLVFVNSGDYDDDGVPDFADGYDVFGQQASFASGSFTPLVFQVDATLPSTATVTFTYDGSDPAGLTRSGDEVNGYEYIPAPGHLRLWTKDGWQSRLKAGLHAGGHYITPGVDYTLAQLAANAEGVITLFVEAVLEASTSLVVDAQLDADGGGPAPKLARDKIRISAPRVDLSVDTDRNGTIGRGPDERGEDRWTPERGAIFNVNFDRDGTNLDRIDNVHPESDAIAFYNDGKIETIINANGKPEIDNAADTADITPFMVRRILAPLPAGAKLFLRVDELEDIQSIHVYKQIAANEEAIWGGLGNRAENARIEPAQPLEVEITPYLNLTADTIFGLEGLFFLNTGTIHPFDGEIDITLEMRLGTDVLRSDKVHLMVAPWIMLPNDQASEKVFAADLSGNDEFLHNASADPGYVGLEHSNQLVELAVTEYERDQHGQPPPPPAGTVLGTRWFQDHIEIGYTGRPGGPKDHVIFQLPYGSSRPNTWARDHLLGPGVGIYQLRQDLGSHDDGGNLEVMPPLGQYSLGRIVVGNNVSQELWSFLTSQEVQSPFQIDTNWLRVGHVDEIIGFGATPGDVIVADAAMAYNLLEAIPQADRGKSVLFATGPELPIAGTVTQNSTTDTRIYTGIDHTQGTQWEYIRIYSDSGSGAAGQVARIPASGRHNGYVEINDVWDTTSKIIDGGDNSTASHARYWDTEAPNSNAWYRLPQQGDKFVLVKGTQFWDFFGTPSFVTVHEVLNDAALRNLHQQYIQPRIDLNKAALEVAAGVPLNFIEVPSLMIGKLIGGDVREAVAYAPGLTNFQLVAGNFYFPRQFGARNAAGQDVFENAVRSAIANAQFVDSWEWYHRRFGEVHCGSVVKRQIWTINWWTWRPPQ